MKNTAYDFQQRYDTIKSLPALALLILGFLDFAFSFAFKNSFEAFRDGPGTCEVAGSAILATYSLFFVLGSTCAILAIFTAAFIYKITHLLSVLICPFVMVGCKKRYHKKPRDFSHY